MCSVVLMENVLAGISSVMGNRTVKTNPMRTAAWMMEWRVPPRLSNADELIRPLPGVWAAFLVPKSVTGFWTVKMDPMNLLVRKEKGNVHQEVSNVPKRRSVYPNINSVMQSRTVRMFRMKMSLNVEQSSSHRTTVLSDAKMDSVVPQPLFVQVWMDVGITRMKSNVRPAVSINFRYHFYLTDANVLLVEI